MTFAVAIVAGLHAGNSATVVLLRALAALMLGAIVGQAAGWTAKIVLREHLQRRKLQIDRAHIESVRALPVAETTAAAKSEPAEVG